MLRNNKAIKRLNKSGSLRHQEKQSKRFQDWIQINVQGSIKSSVYIIVFHSGNVLVLFHFLSTIFSIEGKFQTMNIIINYALYLVNHPKDIFDTITNKQFFTLVYRAEEPRLILTPW